MTECLLWVKTRNLTKNFGCDMGAHCAMESNCDQDRCVFIDSIKKIAEVDAIKVKKGLEELRQELVEYELKGDPFRYEL